MVLSHGDLLEFGDLPERTDVSPVGKCGGVTGRRLDLWLLLRSLDVEEG